MKKSKIKFIIQVVAVILLFIGVWSGGFISGSRWGWQVNLPSPFSNIAHREKPKELPAGDMQVFWDTWKTILSKYVDRQHLDTQKMIEGASAGLVQSLDDPYSVFLNKEQTKDLSQELSGEFFGVGMEIGRKEGFLVVVAPLPNTPAARAGLQPNDKILKIGKTNAGNISTAEAAKLIRGPKGTTVVLTVYRSSWDKTKEIKLVRQKISIPSLSWKMLDNKIAYLQIYNFNQPLLTKFYQAALQIIAAKPQGIIIDLRNDPGGYLESVINISGWFFPKGQVILKEDFGNQRIKLYRSKGPDLFKNIPIVVLTNGGTASAAEILAGALRDNREAKLVGEKTFGKGCVQELVPLKDNGASVKITIAKWLTPKGTIIQNNGLVPDYEVKNSTEIGTYEKVNLAKDKQLQKAIQVLTNQITSNHK